MAHDRFNKKPVIVNIPDGYELRAAGKSKSPAAILNRVPPSLTPEALDIIEISHYLEKKIAEYNRKRAATKVQYVAKVRDEWNQAVSQDREKRVEKERTKIRKREYNGLTREEKIWTKLMGVMPHEFLLEFKKNMAAIAAEKAENKE